MSRTLLSFQYFQLVIIGSVLAADSAVVASGRPAELILEVRLGLAVKLVEDDFLRHEEAREEPEVFLLAVLAFLLAFRLEHRR